MNRGKPEIELYRIAASQGGYFTAYQARMAGYSKKTMHTM